MSHLEALGYALLYAYVFLGVGVLIARLRNRNK